MPPNKAAAPAWQGAPPVSEDGFAFVNGDFFADASGQNQHRRATVAEIKEHFTSGSDRDHPAHWFEAQLIHYGLKPTKAKAVGRMRLLDASKDGKLTVPPSITQLESKLKKEWIKKDREAKKALKGTSVPETKAAGVKRKAGDNASVNDPPAKKAKTTTAKAKAALKEKPKPVAKTATPKAKAAPKAAKTATPKAKAAPKAATASASKAKAKPVAKTTKTATPKTEAVPKATSSAARRGTLSQGPGRSTPSTLPSPAPVPQPRPIQTARRSGAFMARGRIPAPVAQPAWGDGYARYDDNRHSPFNESPPPYTEYDDDDDDDDDDGDDTYGHDVTLRPLGLINGSYGITSSYVTSEWSCYGSDFDLELRLAGNSLWGRFDFGVVEGVMYFERRPRAASRDSVPFIWRGREDQGPIIYGDHNSGWLTFLGDGRIEGSIDYQRLNFRGRRAPDEGTGGGTSVYTLENEWDGYSEDRYENERVSRWR